MNLIESKKEHTVGYEGKKYNYIVVSKIKKLLYHMKQNR